MNNSLVRYIADWKDRKPFSTGCNRKCYKSYKYAQHHRLQLKRKLPKSQEEKTCEGQNGFCPQSPQPPTRSLFDELHEQNLGKEKVSYQIKCCLNHKTCNCFKVWVTLYGYPKKFEGLVLYYFSCIAHIEDRYISQTGNWMYLRLKSNLDCRKVMQYNYCNLLPHPQQLYVLVSLGAPVTIMEDSNAKALLQLIDPKSLESQSEECKRTYI